MTNILSEISAPISTEMAQFNDIFGEALSHTDGLLNEVLGHIRQRGGKRMRPLLTLLIAKNIYLNNIGAGVVADTDSPYTATLHAACSLELLHTASLVHDDVVDEADERRGQASVNASYQNRIAVLVGDYILSTSLYQTSLTQNPLMTKTLAQLGMTLSAGEVRQQENITTDCFSIPAYYEIISKKTAALFEACCTMGAMSVGGTEAETTAAREFGHNLGIVFQIRDDIFDYYDKKDIGKPTGNDMREGKLTLPILHCLNNGAPEDICQMARRVKGQEASDLDITTLISYAKDNGGIEYAREMMDEYYDKAVRYIDDNASDKAVGDALRKYAAYVIGREL